LLQRRIGLSDEICYIEHGSKGMHPKWFVERLLYSVLGKPWQSVQSAKRREGRACKAKSSLRFGIQTYLRTSWSDGTVDPAEIEWVTTNFEAATGTTSRGLA
jgi:hypothetical protein